MTEKEAIDFGKMWLDMNEDAKDSNTYMFIDLGVKALEQQPCEEDYISRKAAINVVHKYFMDYLKLNDDICLDGLRSLPPVTPSRPRGKWIHWTDDYKDYVTCSCCEYGEEGEMLLSDKTPFCPICGADMR